MDSSVKIASDKRYQVLVVFLQRGQDFPGLWDDFSDYCDWHQHQSADRADAGLGAVPEGLPAGKGPDPDGIFLYAVQRRHCAKLHHVDHGLWGEEYHIRADLSHPDFQWLLYYAVQK